MRVKSKGAKVVGALCVITLFTARSTMIEEPKSYFLGTHILCHFRPFLRHNSKDKYIFVLIKYPITVDSNAIAQKTTKNNTLVF